MILSIGALEKQRRKEFAQDNPDYKEKRRVYMREYRKRKKAEGEELAVGSWEGCQKSGLGNVRFMGFVGT